MPTKPTVAKAKRPARTVKEKKFVKAFIENGGNATQAALKAYDTTVYGSATRIGAENTAKLSFDHYFQAAGLTDEKISANIAFIANEANRIHGTDSDFIEIPDHAVRLKANELAIKVMGKFAPPRAPVDGEGNTVVPILGILDVQSEEE